MGNEPMITCGRVKSVTVVKPQPHRTHSLDLDNPSIQTSPLFQKKDSHIAYFTPSDHFVSCSSSVDVDSTKFLKGTLGQEEKRDLDFNAASHGTDSGTGNGNTSVDRVGAVDTVTKTNNTHLIKEIDDFTVLETSQINRKASELQCQVVLSEQSDQGSTNSAPISEGDSGIEPCAEAGEEDSVSGVADGSAGNSLTEKSASNAEIRESELGLTVAEGLAKSSEASFKVEQRDKKKGEVFFF